MRTPRLPIGAPAVLAAIAMIAALAFRHDLVAWFTGPPAERPSSPARSADGAVAYYTCSMHPQVHRDRPGTCPICSMPLVPVRTEDAAAGTVRIDERRRAQLGIRTTRVVRAPLALEIRAAGRVVVDETRLHDVALKIGGYVSHLAVAATGQRVRKGDVLLTLYSPELYASQQEYLIARQNGPTLAAAWEARLKLWGLGDEELRALAGGQPVEHVPFRSPAGGVVIDKAVVEGDAVTAGQRLFRIAELDPIWVEADLHEADLARITKGDAARVALTYLPGRNFDGTVAFVYPYLDAASRTGRIRIALANPRYELKPDMFATVTLSRTLGERLQVPSAAVVYTGPRRLVFVDAGDGRLRPQEVTIGARSGDVVEVLDGVREGDQVVSAGNFLVAAESRIRSTALGDDRGGR